MNRKESASSSRLDAQSAPSGRDTSFQEALPIGCTLTKATHSVGGLILHARVTPPTACCSYCHQESACPHDSCTRHPHDLSWSDQPVLLSLSVRRFRCGNPVCPKKTFTLHCAPDRVASPGAAYRATPAGARSIGFLGWRGGRPRAESAAPHSDQSRLAAPVDEASTPARSPHPTGPGRR